MKFSAEFRPSLAPLGVIKFKFPVDERAPFANVSCGVSEFLLYYFGVRRGYLSVSDATLAQFASDGVSRINSLDCMVLF